MNWKYQLSRLIPMRFDTTYGEGGERHHVRWWQWRDRAINSPLSHVVPGCAKCESRA